MSPLPRALNIVTTVVAICLTLAPAKQAAAEDKVTITPAADQSSVRIEVDGELFAVMHRSDRWKKPFLYPVTIPGWSKQKWTAGPSVVVSDTPVLSADGKPTGKTASALAIITVAKKVGDLFHVPDLGGYLAASDVVPDSALVVRTIQLDPKPYNRKDPKAYDHPHHKGVWISVDEINKIRFWNEDGVIRPDDLHIDGNAVTLTNSWLGKDGEPIIREKTMFEFHPSHLITASISFENATKGEVRFEDTKEGLFGARIASELREREGGKITDAEGRETETVVWGNKNLWVDYSGTRADMPAGLTLFDDPANPRPGRYHVRGYGLFSVSPFGPHAYSKKVEPKNPMILQPGESESFRYGLWIHGETDANAINEMATEFVGEGS